MDTNREELFVNLTNMRRMVQVMEQILDEQGSKTEFMDVLAQLEGECALVRATVIRHSRAWGKGVRADGKPDRRFKSNRGQADAHADRPRPDLRLSKG